MAEGEWDSPGLGVAQPPRPIVLKGPHCCFVSCSPPLGRAGRQGEFRKEPLVVWSILASHRKGKDLLRGNCTSRLWRMLGALPLKPLTEGMSQHVVRMGAAPRGHHTPDRSRWELRFSGVVSEGEAARAHPVLLGAHSSRRAGCGCGVGMQVSRSPGPGAASSAQLVGELGAGLGDRP